MSENKPPEKFNTVFLVSQIQNERSRNVKIGVAVAIVILVAIIYMLFIKEPAEVGVHVPPSNPAPAAAPTQPPPPEQPPAAAPAPK